MSQQQGDTHLHASIKMQCALEATVFLRCSLIVHFIQDIALVFNMHNHVMSRGLHAAPNTDLHVSAAPCPRTQVL